MCRNEIIIMMERERVLSWPELCLTGSWPALPLATLLHRNGGIEILISGFYLESLSAT